MSIFSDIGNAISGAASAVAKAASTVAPLLFPQAALMLGAGNLMTSMFGSALSDMIGQLGKQSGAPSFLINIAKDLVSKAVSQLQQPVDKQAADCVQDTAGSAIKSIVDELMKDFQDAFQNYKNDEAGKCGKGSKGAGGAGGAGSASGGSGGFFQALAHALGLIENQQAEKVKAKAQEVSQALGTSGGSGSDQAQFDKMEDLKAEAQIMEVLTKSVQSVIDKVGAALSTASQKIN